MDRISILIADDEETVLETLAAVMAAGPDLEVVASAHDATTAIELASKEEPDVAFVDVRMPGGGGVRAAREIVRRSPPTHVLALSAHEDASSVLAMLRAGAIGYVVKGDSTEEIVNAIHRCVSERTTISDHVTNELAHTLAEQLHQVRGTSRNEQRRARVTRVLEEDRLRMVFQPIVDLADGSVAGVEALTRFNTRPSRPPDVWFAEAEAVGMLEELELAAVRLAMSELDRVPERCHVFLNLSPGSACSARFRDELRELPLDRLVLEITEHAPVDNYAELNDALNSLRRRGLRIAIDDAGAGFASLRHIVLLAPDLVKLDVTLVRNVGADEVRRAVVTAITAFASQIGARVVAEGVETFEELATLRAIGVQFAQGYYLGIPGEIPAGIDQTWSLAYRLEPATEVSATIA
jgi:EAL domain-containing protein (putative c-di-GMP-specific phosphodiesterase class I)/AmiR/NasT family two-component response regulator